MATLSTTAWVLHDLGLAAGFGSRLFGQLALTPSALAQRAKRERGEVTQEAWTRSKAVDAASLVAAGGTWLIDHLAVDRHAARTFPKLTLAKDVLVAGAVLCGVGSLVAGALLGRARPTPNVAPDVTRDPRRPHRLAAAPLEHVTKLERLTNGLGIATVVFQGAELVLSSVLAVQSARARRRGLFARLWR